MKFILPQSLAAQEQPGEPPSAEMIADQENAQRLNDLSNEMRWHIMADNIENVIRTLNEIGPWSIEQSMADLLTSAVEHSSLKCICFLSELKQAHTEVLMQEWRKIGHTPQMNTLARAVMHTQPEQVKAWVALYGSDCLPAAASYMEAARREERGHEARGQEQNVKAHRRVRP